MDSSGAVPSIRRHRRATRVTLCLLAPLLAVMIGVLGLSSAQTTAARGVAERGPIPAAPTSPSATTTSTSSASPSPDPSGERAPTPRIVFTIFVIVIGIGILMSIAWLARNARRDRTDPDDEDDAEPTDSFIDD